MPTRTVQQTVTPVPELSFQINVLAAEFDEQFPQPGFDVILDKLGAKEKFAYLKLNHGIWELLVQLENLGIPRAQIMTHDGAELDAMTGFSDVPFFGGGFLGPLLARLRNLPDPSQGLTFVSSLEPWPGSYAIEGTPIANRTHTDEIRRYFTDPKHLDNIENGGWTGHELKAAVISQTFGKLIAQMADRPVLLLGNSEFTTALTGWGVHDAQVHNVPIAGARLQRDALRDVVADWLVRHQGQSPLVAANAGEATTTFLGLHAFESFDDIAFLDFGGSLAACAPNIAARANWVTTYKHHLRRVSAEWPAAVAQPMQPVFDSAFAERAPQLVQIATDHGVPQPQPAALTAPGLRSEVQFLENKSPDFQRIADFMTLSAQANRYANGGPVAHLLEQVIAVQLALPAHRHVVAVANGSAALALTCGAAAIETGQSDHLTWLSNGFTFFSASIGPLAQTRAIDCTPDGGFDLNQMASLGADEFGGVIHTNAFANHSKWDHRGGLPCAAQTLGHRQCGRAVGPPCIRAQGKCTDGDHLGASYESLGSWRMRADYLQRRAGADYSQAGQLWRWTARAGGTLCDERQVKRSECRSRVGTARADARLGAPLSPSTQAQHLAYGRRGCGHYPV